MKMRMICYLGPAQVVDLLPLASYHQQRGVFLGLVVDSRGRVRPQPFPALLLVPAKQVPAAGPEPIDCVGPVIQLGNPLLHAHPQPVVLGVCQWTDLLPRLGWGGLGAGSLV